MAQHIKVVNVRAAPRGSYIYIGRTMPRFSGSPWGNPFRAQRVGRPDAIQLFREWVTAKRPDLIVRLADELQRQRLLALGCWCAPERCHGDVLAELVERHWRDHGILPPISRETGELASGTPVTKQPKPTVSKKIIRYGLALTEHKHIWVPWDADPRYERCQVYHCAATRKVG